MSAARKLAVVAPAPKPRLRRVSAKDALRCHPNPAHARAWMRAVAYLRTRTARGWILDRATTKKEPQC